MRAQTRNWGSPSEEKARGRAECRGGDINSVVGAFQEKGDASPESRVRRRHAAEESAGGGDINSVVDVTPGQGTGAGAGAGAAGAAGAGVGPGWQLITPSGNSTCLDGRYAPGAPSHYQPK